MKRHFYIVPATGIVYPSQKREMGFKKKKKRLIGTNKSKAQKDKFHSISSLRIIICGPNSVLPAALGPPRPRTSGRLASVSSALSLHLQLCPGVILLSFYPLHSLSVQPACLQLVWSPQNLSVSLRGWVTGLLDMRTSHTSFLGSLSVTSPCWDGWVDPWHHAPNLLS